MGRVNFKEKLKNMKKIEKLCLVEKEVNRFFAKDGTEISGYNYVFVNPQGKFSVYFLAEDKHTEKVTGSHVYSENQAFEVEFISKIFDGEIKWRLT